MAATLSLQLPLPPSLNEMLDLAKKRTRKSRTGGWMKRSLPVVYDQHLERYETTSLAALRVQGIPRPPLPWPAWELVSADFRVFNARDPIELLASLKWPVDVLVRLGYVANDSPRELRRVCIPQQSIDRRNLGVTLTLRPLKP